MSKVRMFFLMQVLLQTLRWCLSGRVIPNLLFDKQYVGFATLFFVGMMSSVFSRKMTPLHHQLRASVLGVIDKYRCSKKSTKYLA